MVPEPAQAPRRRSLRQVFGVLAVGLFVVALVTVFVVLPQDDLATLPVVTLAPGEDPWEAGNAARDAGDVETAIAYWQLVPPSHPQYARSLRYIGWELYTEELGDPRRGLAYVHRCMLEDPFDGNTWQDAGRTYAALVGLEP